MRPFPLLATLLSALALAFYVVATSSSSWSISTDESITHSFGAFESCIRQCSGVDDCRHINNDCSADFASADVDIVSGGGGCALLRTVRAFLIIAIILTAAALLANYFASFNSAPFIVPRNYATLFALAAAVSGLIAWAAFLAEASRRDDYRYGWAFGLLTAAWILNVISAALLWFTFPRAPMTTQTAATEAERRRRIESASADVGWGESLKESFGLRGPVASGVSGKKAAGGYKRGEQEAEFARSEHGGMYSAGEERAALTSLSGPTEPSKSSSAVPVVVAHPGTSSSYEHGSFGAHAPSKIAIE